MTGLKGVTVLSKPVARKLFSEPMFSWCRRLRLVQHRTVWCPTLLGSFCIAVGLLIPVFWWCSSAESFLSLTQRLSAEVLVVEGWIGRDGVCAAGAEFKQHEYRYVVATGGMSDKRWGHGDWSYADMAERELIRSGVLRDKIIVAPARDTETQRTYQSAVAVWRALQAKGIEPKALNVFTLAAHARRSRLIFAKVYAPETDVGVIGWTPSDYEAGPWWRSSERAKELLTETAGYVYEALLNSGRSSNCPGDESSPDSFQLLDSTTKAAAH
jgi:hypothetical protein